MITYKLNLNQKQYVFNKIFKSQTFNHLASTFDAPVWCTLTMLCGDFNDVVLAACIDWLWSYQCQSIWKFSSKFIGLFMCTAEQERESCTNERTKYIKKNPILALCTSIFNEFQCIFISFTSIVHAFYLPFWSYMPKQFYCNVNTISVPDDAPFQISVHDFQFSPINGKCTKQILNKYLTYRIEILFD